MDSSSLGARSRLGHDTANTTQQGCEPVHDYVGTSLAEMTDKPAYGLSWANTTSTIRLEVHNVSLEEHRAIGNMNKQFGYV